MKLVYPDWKTNIEFSEEHVQILNLENPSYYARIIQELLIQQQTGIGRFVVSEGDKIYDLSKICEIIVSPFSLDFDNKKIQAAIIKQLVQVANEDEYVETKELSGKILQYMYRLTDYLNVDITMDEEVDLAQVMKAVGVKIAQDGENLASRLIDYLFLIRSLFHTELIIGVNFKAYFSQEELALIYETVLLRKIPLLLLESVPRNDKINCENWLTIDADLCEI